MKKILSNILVFLLITFCTGIVLAQGTADRSKKTKGITGIGLELGLNHTSLEGDVADGTSSVEGVCAGVYVNYNIKDWFIIRPELLYTQKGAKQKWEENGEAQENTIHLNYVEIPVLALIQAENGFAFLGPALALKLNSETKIRLEDGTESQDIKPNDFSLVLGFGLNFLKPSQTKGLFAEIRITMGLTKIDDSPKKAYINHSVYSLLIGYCF